MFYKCITPSGAAAGACALLRVWHNNWRYPSPSLAVSSAPQTWALNSCHTAKQWVFSTLLLPWASREMQARSFNVPIPFLLAQRQTNPIKVRALLDLGMDAMLGVVLLCKCPLHSIWIKKTSQCLRFNFFLLRSVGSTKMYLICMFLCVIAGVT